MNATSAMSEPAARTSSNRVESIDFLRGLTILAMIWVNDLASVGGITRWLHHAPVSVDAMTFPDVVFPSFLFIVGMSIPLALGRRVDRGERLVTLLGHVAVRTLGLLAVGVLMVNISALDSEATGLSHSAWAALMYLGVILTWNIYPRSGGGWRILWWALRLAGAALLIWLVAIYHGKVGGQAVWLRTQWWGILGLIGWAYLIGAVSYLFLRREPAALVGVWALLMCLCIADKSGGLGQFALAGWISEYVSLGQHLGGHGAIVLAGMLAVMLPQGSVVRRVGWLLGMAAMLFVAGAVLRVPYGISKNLVSPTWCLYCAGGDCVLYALLYVLMDVGRWRLGTGIIKIVGSNALLAYLLPSLVYSLLRLMDIRVLGRFSSGNTGIVRSCIFTAVMMLLVAGLTKARVRLRL